MNISILLLFSLKAAQHRFAWGGRPHHIVSDGLEHPTVWFGHEVHSSLFDLLFEMMDRTQSTKWIVCLFNKVQTPRSYLSSRTKYYKKMKPNTNIKIG